MWDVYCEACFSVNVDMKGPISIDFLEKGATVGSGNLLSFFA